VRLESQPLRISRSRLYDVACDSFSLIALPERWDSTMTGSNSRTYANVSAWQGRTSKLISITFHLEISLSHFRMLWISRPMAVVALFSAFLFLNSTVHPCFRCSFQSSRADTFCVRKHPTKKPSLLYANIETKSCFTDQMYLRDRLSSGALSRAIQNIMSRQPHRERMLRVLEFSRLPCERSVRESWGFS